MKNTKVHIGYTIVEEISQHTEKYYVQYAFHVTGQFLFKYLRKSADLSSYMSK